MKKIYLVTTLTVFLLALTLLLVPVVAATSFFAPPQAGADSVSFVAKDEAASSEALLASLGQNGAYASEVQNNYFAAITLSEPQTLTNLAPSPAIFAADLAADNSLVYAINSNNSDDAQFITFEPTDPLTLTVVGTIQALDGETWSGMAVTTDTIYASSSNCSTRSTLYTINPFSGVATVVGQMTGSACINAISFDGSGNLWGIDTITDMLVSVDTTTGATSPAANGLGINLGFNQGMDYDDVSGELYLAAFNVDNGITELYTVALTGTATLVGQLGNLGSFQTQFGWLGIEGMPAVIPALPAIALEKTVGTEPAMCGSEDHIFVDAGETVYYCYTVTNIGQVTLTNHSLLDDPLGMLVDDLALTLVPSDSYQHIEMATINVSTINTATWTANQAGANETSSMDSAIVTIVPENGSAPNAPIPDDNSTGVIDTITVSQAGQLADLNVYLDIEHSWVGDLVVTLEHVESDVTVTLIERPEAMTSRVPGDCSGNDIHHLLDDQAALSIQSDCQAGANPTQAYLNGSVYQPAEPLETFALANVPYAGTWRLRVVDQSPTQEGRFVLWALQGTVGEPEIDVMPTSIEATQESDETSIHALTISNSGTSVLTWQISSDVAWASVDMMSGSTAISESSDLSVTFDSTGLAAGTYTGELLINNNDFDEDPVTIPLTLIIKEVVLNPEIEVVPLNLESIQVPNTTTLNSLVISNIGDAILTWTIGIDVAWATVDMMGGSTAINGSSDLSVTFDSTGLAEGNYDGILSITSNDPNENPLNVPLILTVAEEITPQPDISVTPPTLESVLPSNSTTSEGLTIANNGDAALIWTIGIDVAWATVDMMSGSTAISGSSDLLVTFDSTGLAEGSYTGILSITSNDPNENPLNVPLSLLVKEEIIPEANINVTPSTLQSHQALESTTTQALTISNSGDALLTWAITSDVGWATVDIMNGNIAADQERALVVTFDSSGLPGGIYTGILTINNNDPNENPVLVPLRLSMNIPTAVKVAEVSIESRSMAWPRILLVSTLLLLGGGCPLKRIWEN